MLMNLLADNYIGYERIDDGIFWPVACKFEVQLKCEKIIEVPMDPLLEWSQGTIISVHDIIFLLLLDLENLLSCKSKQMFTNSIGAYS